ncbi:sister chromatid cohesion protein 1 [Coemansia spiralis]|uniref:Sister chromatid cohesion protein 1 n=1 Tax=Coemansia spiralis TaxID=417178 RepID=A0A9W8GHM3_9FUNG|nr:sister chromatid cohesion protein 1 [Coemansia spiralis]
MFYAEAILSKKGPLAKVWLAAHLERKLTKVQLLQASIPSSVGAIIGQDQGPPLALRLSGQLLLGVARIYARKARYLLEDCNEALIRIKMAFRPGAADITSDTMVAAHSAITLPEALTEFDILLPSPVRLHGSGVSGSAADSMLELEMAAAAMNTSRIQDITLAEQSFDISMVARGIGEVDLGGEDLLGRDDDFKLDLDADFVFSPVSHQLPEPAMNMDESALEPEVGREAMQGLEEGVVGARAEDISLLGKGVRGLNADGSMMDITREELGGGADGDDMLRFGDGDDLAMQSALGDVSMVPDTQEAALQEAEAEVLAAGAHVARPGKRRRLNLSELVTSEATSLSPDEIRSRLNDPTDIVRVPTYLPLSKSARLEDVGSAAAASRFLAANRDTPFAHLFSTGEFDAEQEVPTATGFGDLDTSAFGAIGEDADVDNLLGEEEFRLEDVVEEGSFGPAVANQQHETELLLADKSFEQLERLEEESLQRQAEEHAHEGSSLFADALPARDEDISIRASQFVDSDASPTRSADGVPQGGLEGVTTSNAGYSKNTIRAIHILDAACTPEREEPLSYQGVAGGARRGDAVKLFFELLVLKSKDFIDVQQVAPFEDILISPCPKLRRAAESISVTTTDDATALAAVAQVDA